jgi:hypothetical protein
MAEVTGTSKMAARCRLSASGPIPNSPIMREFRVSSHSPTGLISAVEDAFEWDHPLVRQPHKGKSIKDINISLYHH